MGATGQIGLQTHGSRAHLPLPAERLDWADPDARPDYVQRLPCQSSSENRTLSRQVQHETGRDETHPSAPVDGRMETRERAWRVLCHDCAEAGVSPNRMATLTARAREKYWSTGPIARPKYL